ncbi:MAG: AbrB/MazE/SpoVT family DNA-binding domain-containing protein [Bacillota bacterium]
MYTTTVSSRGQVVIPAEARKKMGIKEGDVLFVNIEEGGKLVMKAGRKERKEVVSKGVVSKTAGLLSDMEMSGVEYVERIRQGSGRRLDNLEGSY